VTISSGGDVTGCNLTPVGRGMPRAPVPFFGCGGTPHGRGVTASRGQLSGRGVRGEANKQSSQNLYLHYVQGGPLGEGEILRGWCP
jgi:hypothetical protein